MRKVLIGLTVLIGSAMVALVAADRYTWSGIQNANFRSENA